MTALKLGTREYSLPFEESKSQPAQSAGAPLKFFGLQNRCKGA